MANPVDTRKINNDAWLKRKYHQTFRNKILTTFAPFYCSNMNIELFDNNVELPCDIHNEVPINAQHYEILTCVKNVVTWIDNKYGYCNKNVIETKNKQKSTYKTSYIHNQDTTTRLYLHCQSSSNKQNSPENLDEDKTNSTLKETDTLSSSSDVSNEVYCEQLSSNSMFEEEQVTEIDFDNEDVNVKTNCEYENKVAPLNVTSPEHAIDTSKTNVSEEDINEINEITKEDLCSAIFRKRAVLEKKTLRSPVNMYEDISNTEPESNDDINSENISNLGLTTSAIGYDSSSVSEISNNKIKLSKTSLASSSITRKRFNTRSYSENESKRKKMNESFFSDNEESDSNNDSNKVDEITKGDLCSAIFRKCAVLRSEINDNENSLISAQESNDDINSESVSNFGLGTSKMGYDSSSVSEQSNIKINLVTKNKKTLKNAFTRKLDKTSTITSLQHHNEPDNDELNSPNYSTRKVSKRLHVQSNEEETQSHTASPKLNSPNRSTRKVSKRLHVQSNEEETQSHTASPKLNSPNFSTRRVSKRLHVQSNEEKTQSHTASPKPNSPNCSTRKVSKRLHVQSNEEKTQKSHTASPKKNSANCSKKKDTRYMYLRNKKGETRLHLACAKGNYNLVNSLLSQGFNPNVKDNAGWTPMHEAVKMGCLNVIKELIEYGAYINAPGFEYETPLYTAIKYNKNDVAALLLQNGADTKCVNIYGKSAQSINEDNWSKLLKNCKIPSTPLQNNRIYTLDKITVFFSNSSLNQVTVATFCHRFNIKLIKNVNQIEFSQVTHIIVPETKKNTCDLNLECLIGIANGLFIVNENWIIDSLKEEKLVDCENYEVVGTSSSVTNGPKKSRLNKEKLCPKLFDGINIHISGSTGWKEFSLDELNKLVLEFGGKILKRMPNPEDCASNIIPYHCHNSEKMYCVSNIILYTKESNRLIKYNMKHLKAFPVSWFIEAGQKYSII